MRKILFLIPLSFALIATVNAENNEIARGGGGGGGGHAGGAGHAGDRGDLNRGDLNRGDFNRNDGVGGYGGYGGGAYYNGGYAPVLLPDPVLTPNDDMDSLYEQNLKSMRKTGQ